MAYEKQTWKNGDVITDTKLNHMEDGINDLNVQYITSTYNSETRDLSLDKTWKEIHDAFESGHLLFAIEKYASDWGSEVHTYDNIAMVIGVEKEVAFFKDVENTSTRYTVFLGDALTFETETENGFPTYTIG